MIYASKMVCTAQKGITSFFISSLTNYCDALSSEARLYLFRFATFDGHPNVHLDCCTCYLPVTCCQKLVTTLAFLAHMLCFWRLFARKAYNEVGLACLLGSEIGDMQYGFLSYLLPKGNNHSCYSEEALFWYSFVSEGCLPEKPTMRLVLLAWFAQR